jgi:hypothetical protein
MTPEQFAGLTFAAFWFSLPAAITTTVPRDRAELIAFWVVVSHAPWPPKDKLITRATLVLAGTPLTLPPEAHTIASAMSEV